MKHKGFTLIEFVVIISIFAIMASVALFNFAGFRSNVGLNNLAHDIALTIRQAQVFGWSTTTAAVDANGDPLRYAQGVYFPYSNGEYSKEFVLYTKTDPNPSNASYIQGLDTIADVIKIQGPNHISDIRTGSTAAELALDPISKAPAGGISVGTDVSIAFSRPRPESLFYLGINPLIDPATNYMGIYIVADSTCESGSPCTVADHVITVSRFGEIIVQ